MVQQQERVKKPPAPVERVPSPDRTTARSSPWLVGGLVVMTLAVFALGGWTLYQRLEKRDAERLAQGAVAAWDSGRPAALADVYDPAAVLVDADGTRIAGLDAIAAAVADRGPTFTVTQVGGVTTTSDGSYATTSYRFTGDGQGVGVSMIKVDGGKIVRQWIFEPRAETPR